MTRRWIGICAGLTAMALAPELGLAQAAYTLPPDKLAQAEALARIRTVLHFGDALWGLAALWLLLETGAAARAAAWIEQRTRNRAVQGLQFFALLLLVLTVADLPIGAYAHWISLRYGISVQGWGSWFADLGKALALTVGLGSPIMLLFHWIVRKAPLRFWLWGWAAAVVLMVFSAFIEPLGEPIFNKYEPLAKSNPVLVAKLEKVVARTGTQIPPERMYLMKASLKTNGLNAYVSGLGATKRVVVWDTTAGRISDDEILFIFGHESGHYVLRHIPKGLALSAAGMLLVFWACAWLAEALVRRRGMRWGAPSLAARSGFIVLLLVASVAGFVLEPVDNAVSRYFEHEADIYGQEAIHGIVADPQQTAVRAFNDLGSAWLETPTPGPFVVWWSYSHPSIPARAEFAREYDPWANGGRGRFFAR
ncbi:MAG: M48 family metallopeptidase [Terracidiphilus sp.]|nr:M48 family metallopeptidase [Terracidiphilus sp.]